MSKKKWGRYPAGFRQQALERLKVTGNVAALARELGVHRSLLYYWKNQQHGGEPAAPGGEETDLNCYRIRELEQQVASLEGVIGRQELELDFFVGALRRVEEKRRSKDGSGETGSTNRSGGASAGKAN